MENAPLTRYSEITEKNRREIVLLRGSGCKWRRCTFCDYHLDFSPDETSNFALNQEVLGQVTGKYGRLEVINSGSFVDLDDRSILSATGSTGTQCLHSERLLRHMEYRPRSRSAWRHSMIGTANRFFSRVSMRRLLQRSPPVSMKSACSLVWTARQKTRCGMISRPV